MDDDILVLDEFLPTNAYENLERLVSNEPMANWSRCGTGTDPVGCWRRNFVPAVQHNLAEVGYVLGETSGLDALRFAWHRLRHAYLSDSVLLHCYLSGYMHGAQGYVHTDPCVDHYTALVYMNDRWEPDWAGETVFLDERDEIVKSVLPKKNRVVIVPAHFRCADRSVSKKCPVLRKTLIFKTRKRRSDNFEKLSVFLRKNGALNHKHSTGTLHDHLVRTFSILEMHGFDQKLCFGAGLHAIYGTNRFGRSIMTENNKSTIIDEFGEDAERLAYLYSILDQPRTLEFPIELNLDAAVVERSDKQTMKLRREIFDDLRTIACANLVDLNLLEKYPILCQTWGYLCSPVRSDEILAA
jgi:SM-20-related protein